MDWHSSGITTSVIGALSAGRALARRARHSCLRRPGQAFPPDAGRADNHRRSSRHRCPSAHASQPPRGQGRQCGGAGRFRSLPPRVYRTDDGHWTVVQQGMNGEKRQARRYHWHSGTLSNFIDEPHSAIDGPSQGQIINLTDRRGGPSRSAQLDLLADPRPGRDRREFSALITFWLSSRCRFSSCRRITMCDRAMSLRADCTARSPRRQSGTGRFSKVVADAGRWSAHRAIACYGGRDRARRTLSVSGPRALFTRAWREGSPSLSRADQGLRRNHPRSEINRAAYRALRCPPYR